MVCHMGVKDCIYKISIQDMGCMLTIPEINEKADKELRSYLTAKDISHVQETWKLVMKDMDNIGLLIFKRLFLENKDLKKLFSARLGVNEDLVEDPDDEVILDELKLRDHARIVMEALGSAVECLNNSEQLTSILIGIGERHVMYGVRPEMMPLLWPPIITTFKEYLGSDLTPETARAWEDLFSYICNKVTDGMLRWQPDINFFD